MLCSKNVSKCVIINAYFRKDEEATLGVVGGHKFVPVDSDTESGLDTGLLTEYEGCQ